MTKHYKAVATEQDDNIPDDGNEDDYATENEVDEINDDKVVENQLDTNLPRRVTTTCCMGRGKLHLILSMSNHSGAGRRRNIFPEGPDF